MRNLKDIFLWNKTGELNGELEIALESVMDGDIGPAFSHVCRLIREELDQIPKETGDRILYRFVGFPLTPKGKNLDENEIIKDIREGRITLSNPADFNDPMDPIIRVWTDLHRKETNVGDLKTIAELVHKAMGNFRICCLARDVEKPSVPFFRPKETYENVLMWGHYAKGHKGICIKYRIKPETLTHYTSSANILLLGDVRYRAHKEVNDYITIDNALLAKSDSWKYENETRLIYFAEEENSLKYPDGATKNYLPIDGFDIEAIYMGYKMDKRYKRTIWKAINGKNIDLYQMEFDRDDITCLKARKVIT